MYFPKWAWLKSFECTNYISTLTPNPVLGAEDTKILKQIPYFKNFTVQREPYDPFNQYFLSSPTQGWNCGNKKEEAKKNQDRDKFCLKKSGLKEECADSLVS